MRKTLLTGATLGALMEGSAHAQVQAPGVYGFAQGTFLFDAGKRDYAFQSVEPRLGTRDGVGGRLQVGYRFEVPVDVAIAAQGAAFRRDRPRFTFAERLSANYVALDLEVGYTIELGGAAIRPAIGPRYVDFRHSYTESGDHLAMKYKAIGPRAALSASGRLGDSDFSLFGDISGSVLFGRLREFGGGDDIPQHRAARSRTAFNTEAQVGIAWVPFPLVSIAAGIRGEAWWGVNDTRAGNPLGIDGRGDRIGVGPFIRVAYNWGAPPAGSLPAPRGHGDFAYFVFFDFDRASLTAQAVATIKQAAAQAKTGKVTRISVTGHADRSGTDAYNMALSLRRANAVKDQLVREGIAANSIAVVGRGESEPLVPTADGVREPQNRRVQIVLG